MHGRLVSQLTTQENGDMAPTAAMLQGFAVTCRDLTTALTSWRGMNAKDLPVLNAALTKSGAKGVSTGTALPTPKC